MNVKFKGIAGELSLPKMQWQALRGLSTGCLVLGAPGFLITLVGLAISNEGGISESEPLDWRKPKSILGWAIAVVGFPLAAPLLLRGVAERKMGLLEKKMAKISSFCEEDALRLGREGKFNDLEELLKAFCGKNNPLATPVAGSIALGLFSEAISKDDAAAVARYLNWSGGQTRFEALGVYMSKADMFLYAAKVGAKNSCNAFMAAGAKSLWSPAGVPWSEAKDAGHMDLYKTLSAYHSAQLEPSKVKKTRFI